VAEHSGKEHKAIPAERIGGYRSTGRSCGFALYPRPMSGLAFLKMHGLGNDFVVLDARASGFVVDAGLARRVADRHRGVGCDQVIVVEPSVRADAFMRILNADGSEAGACGNATRCVADLLCAESGAGTCVVETVAGLLPARRLGPSRLAVDMGRPRLDWRDIPLARPMDTLHVDLAIGPASAPVLADPVAVNMGNPHAVFFVADAAAVDLATVGPMLEHHPLFPERANIGIAEVADERRLRLRVWERGVGITQACGSGACAAAVAAIRRGLTGRRVEVRLDGGSLAIDWPAPDAGVIMAGPVATSFTGILHPSLLEAPAEAAA